MMAIFGFIVAVMLFSHFTRRLKASRALERRAEESTHMLRGASWHEEWERHWAEKFRRREEWRQSCVDRHAHHKESRRRRRRRERAEYAAAEERAAEAAIRAAMHGHDGEASSAAARDAAHASRAAGGQAQPAGRDKEEAAILKRARRRARAEVGFYAHLMSYLGVMGFLALLNILTARYPWFLWPALGWGLGLFSHYMAVFGSRTLKERYFYPAVEREVRRETMSMRTEKQASIDELSATIAHEIRNPIAAAKSLVQQMGEDPRSVENVEYANVALEELDRVEKSISHLLRFAKEEDLTFAPASLAGVVDAALTEMRAKLDAGKVAVARNYIGGPTIVGDAEKLRQVFANVIDNAIDALEPVEQDRKLELFIENGLPNRARVRVRDNGIGIAPEKIDRIFNPFFTTKEKGTGLGMAISKKIVEAHEGAIDVLSEPGRGTEFVVTLPLPH
jgi:signal transduction histidine kinase